MPTLPIRPSQTILYFPRHLDLAFALVETDLSAFIAPAQLSLYYLRRARRICASLPSDSRGRRSIGYAEAFGAGIPRERSETILELTKSARQFLNPIQS